MKKGGGGGIGGFFSRYCVACAISVETGKVLNYEIACIVAKCVLRSNKILGRNEDLAEYKIWKECLNLFAKPNNMANIVQLCWNQNYFQLFSGSQLNKNYFIPQSLPMGKKKYKYIS